MPKSKHSRRTDGRPSWQFYPTDWLAESSLKLCDLSARGLWIDLLCHAFLAEDRGKLTIMGKHLGSTELAALVGRPEAEVEASLKQLIEYGVCEKSEAGCIYSRRMVRDESTRQSKVEAGRKGGKTSKPPIAGSKSEAEGEAKEGSSSSASSSASISIPTAEEKKDNVYSNV